MIMAAHIIRLLGLQAAQTLNSVKINPIITVFLYFSRLVGLG